MKPVVWTLGSIVLVTLLLGPVLISHTSIGFVKVFGCDGQETSNHGFAHVPALPPSSSVDPSTTSQSTLFKSSKFSATRIQGSVESYHRRLRDKHEAQAVSSILDVVFGKEENDLDEEIVKRPSEPSKAFHNRQNGTVLDGWGVPLPNDHFFGKAPFEHRIAVVLHCGAKGRDHLVRQAHNGWLKNIRHILASDKTDASLGTVGFPDNPGQLMVDFVGYDKYIGAHRSLFAMLMANNTFGEDVDWIIQGDDDTWFDIPKMVGLLKNLDPEKPLFLAHRLGPKNDPFTRCEPQSKRTKESITCCSDHSQPCPVHVPKIDRRSGLVNRTAAQYYSVDEHGQTVHATCADERKLPRLSKDMNKCCPVVEAPENFKKLGFHTRTDKDKGINEYHTLKGWPYGGEGYLVSKGMMKAIGKDNWEDCAHRIQCHNADQRVEMCIFNNGYQLSPLPYSVKHHLHRRRQVRRRF